MDLVRVRMFELRNPAAPWLASEAVGLLSQLLRPIDHGLEFGSGRSTVWFAERTAGLTSVETNARWFACVERELQRRALRQRVNYRLIAADEMNVGDPYRAAYLAVAEDCSESSLDYVLVLASDKPRPKVP